MALVNNGQVMRSKGYARVMGKCTTNVSTATGTYEGFRDKNRHRGVIIIIIIIMYKGQDEKKSPD